MKKTPKFDLVKNIEEFFKITPYMNILEWIEKFVDYSDDVSAERTRPDFSQYHYQIEPIKQWEDLSVRKHVTIVSCEQMRKYFACKGLQAMLQNNMKNEHVYSRSLMANGLRPLSEPSRISE